MQSSARVLVVNDDPAESGKLAAKLKTQGYQGLQAVNSDALKIALNDRPDVVIMGGRASDSSSSNFASAMKNHHQTAQVPLIMIADAGDITTRIKSLGAGADACLPHHYHDLQLFGRIESMLRLATMQEELRRRRETARNYGFEGPGVIAPPVTISDANFLFVGPADQDYQNIEKALIAYGTLVHAHSAASAITYLERKNFDTIIVNVRAGKEDDFYLFCHEVRRNARLYNIPIVCMIEGRTPADITAAFTAGVADVFHHPVNVDDLQMRIDVLVRQQRYRDALRDIYRQPRNVATTDSLTGLYNYGFLMQYLSVLVADAQARGKNLAASGFSVDNLAEINAEHGYAVGDKILRQAGLVVSTLVRGEDLPARADGGQFILVMPETSRSSAELVAHRIGSVINYTEITAETGGKTIQPHVSTWVSSLEPGMSPEQLVAKALNRG